MLDIKFIVNNADDVARNAKARGYDVDVDAIIALDQDRRTLIVEIEERRKESKALAAKSGAGAVDPDSIRARARAIKEAISQGEARLREIEDDLNDRLARVPNMLDPRVPMGSEDDFTLFREWGTPRRFDFTPRSHEDVAEGLDMLDIARGVSVAGSRFYVLKNDAVRLRYAMIGLWQAMVADAPWQLVSPPLLARPETLFTAGYTPFASKENYKIEDSNLSLIGTSEQAILGFHIDEILESLPLLYMGDSMCFRTEAGAAGRDTRGIIRVHQFFKLEQVVFCRPEESEHWHLQCLANEERFLQLLDIPYRVIVCSSGDIAAPGHFKYDIEAWMPGQDRYREVTSNTNLTDFQTRRGNIRWRDEDGKRVYPHTISATGFCDRHLLALLETHQNEDGSLTIPPALVPYMGGVERIG
ncbi:MAG: serine--tRNA ligase [Sphingomonas sp. 28-66-16]|nr:MAG: serine--tRNA ligase [Sphingomonas sp. 28-66-16]